MLKEALTFSLTLCLPLRRLKLGRSVCEKQIWTIGITIQHFLLVICGKSVKHSEKIRLRRGDFSVVAVYTDRVERLLNRSRLLRLVSTHRKNKLVSSLLELSSNHNIWKHSLRACELAFAMSGKEALLSAKFIYKLRYRPRHLDSLKQAATHWREYSSCFRMCQYVQEVCVCTYVWAPYILGVTLASKKWSQRWRKFTSVFVCVVNTKPWGVGENFVFLLWFKE